MTRITLRTRAAALVGALVLVNAMAWLVALSASHRSSALWGKAFLAYGFGLRHAVDADHISAIDNTTRRLIQQEKQPLGVGLYFALGHSTIVVMLSAGLAASSGYVIRHLPFWQDKGGLVGTLISTAFLYIIGAINLVVLWELWRSVRRNKMGGDIAEASGPTGLLAAILKPILRLVKHSWQMYFVGFLFGLGFDTATEVGILAMSVRSGQVGMPFWTIMILPLLFTVGMCLVDTLDGILMAGAYGWAYINPARKLSYNIGITFISVVVAFGVGTSELLQLMSERHWLTGPWAAFFKKIDTMHPGYTIIGIFVILWIVAMARDSVRSRSEARL